MRIDGLRVANNADLFGAGIRANLADISNCTVTTNAGDGILLGAGTVGLNFIGFNGGNGILSPSSVEGVTALKRGLVATITSCSGTGKTA